MVRYPYVLWVLTSTTGTIDTNGNPQPGTSAWENRGPCRDMVNNKGQEVTLEDGTTPVFEVLIFLPLSLTSDLQTGDLVGVYSPEMDVYDSNQKPRFKGTVKRFSRDQLHCRLWV